uniref:Uncharacterized protein n=1 Tax=Thermofilum pendens TaxID=2269 RepID=A0A7C4D2H5_THEPE
MDEPERSTAYHPPHRSQQLTGDLTSPGQLIAKVLRVKKLVDYSRSLKLTELEEDVKKNRDVGLELASERGV